jgi:hypothetical protein
MGEASSRSRSRRSMRVATIFTGVTACTFGAATQVANAQDATHTAVTHTATRAGLAILAGGPSYGSIRMAYNCGAAGIDHQWLHVSVTSYIGPSVWEYKSLCFGYFGLWNSPPYTGVRKECGGNNHGLLVGVNANGTKWSTGYGPGTTYRTLNKAHLDGVFVNSWTGTDTCPKAPDFGGGHDG